jgi:hypothetical protein
MGRVTEREREREKEKGSHKDLDDQHYNCLSPFPVEHTKGDFQQQLLLVLSAVAAVLLFVCRF